MAGIKLEKGKVIYKSGQPMTALHMITAGSVGVLYPGGSFTIGKGDVIGICEVCSEVHFLEYQTIEDTEILTYSLPNMSSLNDLLQKHPDVAGLFIVSAFRQTNDLLSQCDVFELSCSSMYRDIMNDYQTYCTLCNRYRITPRALEGIDTIDAYLEEESADLWLNGYYLGLLHIFKSGGYKTFVKEPAVSMGLVRKASLDFRKTFLTLEEQYQYQANISQYYFNEDCNDLFDLMTSLYYKVDKDSRDSRDLHTDINRIIQQTGSNPSLRPEMVSSRAESFLKNASVLSGDQTGQAETGRESVITELADSLNIILEFAGTDLEAAASFRRQLISFKALSDKSSMEDTACALRRQLAEDFYTLYAIIFEKTLTVSPIPIPVQMFLYFGYADDELAGAENSRYLYSLAESINFRGEAGVYTFYDWLLAIFHGRKEPSRNEFDQDYSDYIHKQKMGGTISEADLIALKTNNMGKVIFELKNMFPQVNKITYGRITTFCPVFMAENVLKDLPSLLVTASNLGHALEQIRKIDYSAFYRETLDTEHLDVMGRQYIHVEFLPDFILMPNVGVRGVMWQEIEGKNRVSPSRMLFSIFHLEDISTTLVRLTGEYRWEICKRIQGGRWNDIGERSLTSEYFDYVQFYRKNNELTADAKERVRLGLQRAKNSFKEMFVRDYLLWILFEGTGSPRLNPVARSILFTYCTFPESLSSKLKQNPLFTDLLTRRDIRTAQKLHHLDMLEKKIISGKKEVPDILEKERKFAKGDFT